MKKIIRLTTLLALVIFSLNSCDNALHNGTEMAISKVTLTGLPENPYAEDQEMIFSYDTGGGWIHDNDFTNPIYSGKVSADGTLTYTFNPPLVITTPSLIFILIDPNKTWDSLQIDQKHSGGKGGDATLDNKWTGEANPIEIEGVVDGDSVTWNYKGE